MRPNIRVEIQNNLVESMEVDEENEEGEISDNENEAMNEAGNVAQGAKPITKPFMTAIINKKEDEKLQERARRFHLNPEEIKNFKEEDIQILYSSLGINASNESNIRFEAIHMRGIDQMSASDILDYFLEYAPQSIEWIDEECCNVVWSDQISACRALHFISKAVRGMPVRDDSSYFDPLNEEVDQSILLLNKDREIQLTGGVDEPLPNKLLNKQNSIDISEITSTIPPGFWRLGKKNQKGVCVLLRFSQKTDRAAFKVEQFKDYYRKSKKFNKPERHGIFGRNKEMRVNQENPWSTLAKNWDEDEKFREKDRNEVQIDVKNPVLKQRLGAKRKDNPEPEVAEKEEEKEEEVPKKKVKIPRMRMYADDEEEKIKRRQMLQKINHQIKRIDDTATKNSDLRSVLNMTSRTVGVNIKQEKQQDQYDLGSKLKNRNKKMVFQIKSEASESRTRRRRSPSPEEEVFDYPRRRDNKPKSKVAVVIKTQKKPSVASKVGSRLGRRYEETESESESEESSEESNDAEEERERMRVSRPGFDSEGVRLGTFKSPLKIEINNDHFRK